MARRINFTALPLIILFRMILPAIDISLRHTIYLKSDGHNGRTFYERREIMKKIYGYKCRYD